MPIMYVNPAPKRRRKVTKKKRTASRRKNAAQRTGSVVAGKNPSTKRRAAAKKAARTRAAKKRMRSLAAKKAAATRRRRNPARKTARRRRKNPWSEKKTQKVTRRVARGHRKAAMKGWRRRKRKNPAPMSYKRRYNRRRRNPAGIMDLVMQVVPVAGSLYGSRLLTGMVSDRLTMIPETFRKPAVAGGILIAGHFATQKVVALRKYRAGVMVGLGINLLDKFISAFAPESLKGMLGVSDYGTDIYGPALSEYVTVGATPIEDDITLADYVAVDDYVAIGEFEAELGQIEADLGMEMDLGDFADRKLGGVARSSMQAPIGSKRYLAPVPTRSFTKVVPPIGQDYDKSDLLYTGIFAGGC